jgi:hypothetical protein
VDLESFQVFRDGQRFQRVDFNFWGVTFARDSNTFYATLGSDGRLYLIRGDVRARRAEVIHHSIECPSLSPDNRLIAFKKRSVSGGRATWRLAILELETSHEWLIDSESRNVDDQVEWLDDRRILYAVSDQQTGRSGTSVWVADVKGGMSQLWTDGAYSPSVGMPPQP